MAGKELFLGLPYRSGRERFLPDFRSLGATLILALFGEFLAFVFTLAAVDGPADFWSELGLNSFFILWIVLTSQGVMAVLSRYFESLRAVAAGFWVFLIVIMATLLLTWLSAVFSLHWVGDLTLQGDNLSFGLLRNSVLAGLVVFVVLRYQYVQYLMRLQARAEGLARLDALQSRMRPHFLFNSLNSIATLTRRDPRLAEELCLDLAELFRAILRKDRQLGTLEEELILSRQYLNIEQQRLGGRLKVEWKLDDGLLRALIPPLSLQPLIENAVYHGIEPAAKGGLLTISCQSYQKDKIILSVRNSMPEEKSSGIREGNKMALKNLRLRLQSFFGEDGKIMSSMSDGFYQTRIIIPFTIVSP